MIRTGILALAIGAMVAAGCSSPAVHQELVTAERLDCGLTLILPGIEGAGMLSEAIQRGLNDAGVHDALPVCRWGNPIPLAGPLLNQLDSARARQIGATIARAIVRYRRRFPDRPVHLVGHSGGGAVAVFALESLPATTVVDGAILLSPSLSAGYDLAGALAHTRKGIAHFWSRGDVALLVVGTTVFGNLDGVHGPAAGARGFTHVDGPADLFARLYQRPWRPAMMPAGHFGGHLGAASSAFVAQWVARWIQADIWPPSVATLAAADRP